MHVACADGHTLEVLVGVLDDPHPDGSVLPSSGHELSTTGEPDAPDGSQVLRGQLLGELDVLEVPGTRLVGLNATERLRQEDGAGDDVVVDVG